MMVKAFLRANFFSCGISPGGLLCKAGSAGSALSRVTFNSISTFSQDLTDGGNNVIEMYRRPIATTSQSIIGDIVSLKTHD